ncbi:MAG: D-glycerate dehydrogenase [Paracoccus sp. (in: a-proteobacteria)]|uniref:2-hydroxyacid dehydrogenase n=1 Tax=Paracoccus sp. TaxID=267 RepID=UPI0026DEF677|nr:D-glycerate dehydrogenase [Paracoccus sp. (in: a-proteobacteria)]MDO5622203.1 D-glycerate dehydrogenase [Paracoccus sp. (in: a-proteobacteria)]
MKRLLVTRRMTAAAETAIRAAFDATFRDEASGLTPVQAVQVLAEYDAVMPALGDAFTAEAFEGQPRARLIANFGAGYNHIDVAAARAAGIAVTNTPDAVTDATADLAMTLLLMSARRASEGERLLRAGNWHGWQPTQFLGTHVSGKTLGVIGVGRIGQAIARRAHYGFRMRIVFHNRSARALDFPAQQLGLSEVLAQADFVVLAVPGGVGTRHLIGADELAQMQPQAHLINIARGDVVDEAALIAALQAGRIAGAGLDVYEREPDVPEALRSMDNVTLLPHLGTATEETRTAMALRALANLNDWAAGQSPRDLVN